MLRLQCRHTAQQPSSDDSPFRSVGLPATPLSQSVETGGFASPPCDGFALTELVVTASAAAIHARNDVQYCGLFRVMQLVSSWRRADPATAARGSLERQRLPESSLDAPINRTTAPSSAPRFSFSRRRAAIQHQCPGDRAVSVS
jgi:hypothetical protein